jgi:hypothetical protein
VHGAPPLCFQCGPLAPGQQTGCATTRCFASSNCKIRSRRYPFLCRRPHVTPSAEGRVAGRSPINPLYIGRCSELQIALRIDGLKIKPDASKNGFAAGACLLPGRVFAPHAPSLLIAILFNSYEVGRHTEADGEALRAVALCCMHLTDDPHRLRSGSTADCSLSSAPAILSLTPSGRRAGRRIG